MTYKVNGTEITVQPTTGKWLDKESIGIDGNGRPIYPLVREFELSWQLVPTSQVYQLQNFFNTVGQTGTSVVSLPQYAANTYTFYDYSGCVLHEPRIGEYFNEHQTSVVLMVTKIRT